MSLGGLVSLSLAVHEPELVRRLVLVDITPGTTAAQAGPIAAFLAGPERFASFQAMLDRTVAFNPTRSLSSLRRGIIHNAREFPGGTWGWRWDPALAGRDRPTDDFQSLWPLVDRLAVPLLVVRGSQSGVVSDDDIAEVMRRQPGAAIEVVAGAGHSIQGDQPVELARRLAGFLTR
jgi:pimeloyl-ACP methyl ester carboxylesterase